MIPRTPLVPLLLAAGALCFPATSHATDVDGPNDCLRELFSDFGDAPENALAYPGVPGAFPTCLQPGPVGTRTIACAPISSAPGPAGFVRHGASGGFPYWLGCGAAAPAGYDAEPDGKTNATGNSISACSDQLVDCVETAFGMNFGQDECYGSSDAGIADAIAYPACGNASVRFTATSCDPNRRDVFLNVLVDWNRDGDWNDNFQCAGACSYEWALKNVVITLEPGCQTYVSPAFLTGPSTGNGWLRITLSDAPMPDDFPWNGTASIPTQQARGGETEDYPVTVGFPPDCPDYTDWGDAPEEVQAYPGIPGHFPTCGFGSGPGTQQIACVPALSTPPGAGTGFVRHAATGQAQVNFWLGCAPVGAAGGVDGEPDGKMNDNGGGFSVCASNPVDCLEAAFGLTFGQDECYGDTDAGIGGPMLDFVACDTGLVNYRTYNCGIPTTAYLNILVDMNHDGDWNDNFQCAGGCAYEWAVKNVPIALGAGCETRVSPPFRLGPDAGPGWLRITVTPSPVTDDFPWAGSALLLAQEFRAGETEDYPVRIRGPEDPCDHTYQDFGDAPEEIAALPSGASGHYPTCVFPSTPGTQEVECGTAPGTPPGPTGYVRHLQAVGDPAPFWLGCGITGQPQLGVDGEIDGKVNLAAFQGLASACEPAVTVDCLESVWADYGQDECYGTADAALGSRPVFGACSTSVFQYLAYNCSADTVEVYLNVLVDWNQDADWNDVIKCRSDRCVREWSVKNFKHRLIPGCGTYLTPPLPVGLREGFTWMRMSLTRGPVQDDFPWNGSGSEPNAYYRGGETEDYPVFVQPSTVGAAIAPPDRLWLAPPRPNPSFDRVALRFVLPRAAEVTLDVMDVSGRRLARLVEGRRPAGEHAVVWEFRDASGAELSAGIYLVRLRVGEETLTRRIIRVR